MAPAGRGFIAVVLIAAGAQACGGRGRVVTLASLDGKELTLTVSPDLVDAARPPYALATLTFPEVDQRLEDDCPRLEAAARLDDQPLVAIFQGGPAECAPFESWKRSCNRCLPVQFQARISAVVAQHPPSPTLAVTDGSGSVSMTLASPFPAAAVTIDGVTPGQVVQPGQLLPLSVSPEPPLAALPPRRFGLSPSTPQLEAWFFQRLDRNPALRVRDDAGGPKLEMTIASSYTEIEGAGTVLLYGATDQVPVTACLGLVHCAASSRVLLSQTDLVVVPSR
jgi:hypothetical protein